MMLRSRNVNANAAPENAKQKDSKSVAEVPAKRNASQQPPGQPDAKRHVLADISQGISKFLIDSTKKSDSKENRGAAAEKFAATLGNECSRNLKKPKKEAKIEKKSEDPCPEFDYDEKCYLEHDEFSVPEFAADIFKYSRSREHLFAVPDYMRWQTGVTSRTRAVIVDWMVELQETFELNHETLYLAVKLWDLFMARTKTRTLVDQGQMLCCVCLFIAAKFDERQPPLVDDFLFVSEDRFLRDDFLKMECEVLDTVGFDLGAPLSYTYLRRLARVTASGMVVLTLSRYILETTLHVYQFVGVRESLLASASFYLSMKMISSEAVWTPVCHKYSGYTEKEVAPLVDELNHMLHLAHHQKLDCNTTVSSKYSHPIFHEAAMIPPLPRKFDLKRQLMKDLPFAIQQNVLYQ